MSAPTVAEMLKYVNLQMAAEAFLTDSQGNLITDLDLLKQALVRGNGHASHFTEQQAEDFSDPVTGWTVIAQQPNTTTGFSGTLFRNNETGELVISFRSTEFIDDAARDNLATNTLEIKDTGWAWGQIADMEAWYASLKADGLLTDVGGNPAQISVTGYSLGGHLATAFNLLHGEDTIGSNGVKQIQQVVTFNGAGVGEVDAGYTLKNLVSYFKQLQSDPAQIEASFANAQTPANQSYWERAA